MNNARRDQLTILYREWLKKPCWTEIELLFLMLGLDPIIIPGGMEVDLDQGNVTPMLPDSAIFRVAVTKEAQCLGDYIHRSILAGELVPTLNGGDCFRPLPALRYLKERDYSLPESLDTLLTQEINEWNESPIKLKKEIKPDTSSWKMLVQAEAARRWTSLRNSGANPTKNSLKDDLARWCREHEVKTKTGINPNAEYISRHVLRDWIPPKKA